MYTKEELLKLSEPDPELAAHLAVNPFPGIPWDNIQALREFSGQRGKRAEEMFGPAPEGIHESIQVVKARDGHELQQIVARPTKPPADGSPLILLVHGGGHIMGHNISLTANARNLAKLFGAVVVSLQYRLAPEFPFPQGNHDIMDGTKWFASNAASFGADPSKGFIIGGASAGGQLTATTAQSLADEGFTPKLTGLWQNITVVLTEGIVPEQYKSHWLSREDPHIKNAIILNTDNIGAVDGFWKPDYKSVDFSPFNSPTAMQGIPRTYFQVCGQDPLRDDSFIFEDALKQKGVETRVDVYPGVPHGFNNIFPGLKASKKWNVEFLKGMGWLLGRSVTDEQLGSLSGGMRAE